MLDVPRTEASQAKPDPKDHTVAHIDPLRQRIWDDVSRSPVHNLWGLSGRVAVGDSEADGEAHSSTTTS